MASLFLLVGFAWAMWLTWLVVRDEWRARPRPTEGRTWLGVLVDALEDDR